MRIRIRRQNKKKAVMISARKAREYTDARRTVTGAEKKHKNTRRGSLPALKRLFRAFPLQVRQPGRRFRPAAAFSGASIPLYASAATAKIPAAPSCAFDTTVRRFIRRVFPRSNSSRLNTAPPASTASFLHHSSLCGYSGQIVPS